MTRLIAWWGEEHEGIYRGLDTLFIRGGHEDKTMHALGICAEQSLSVKQIYFGAGSTKPDMAKVVHLAKYLDGQVLTVEIEASQAHEIPPFVPDEHANNLNIMLTVVVPRIENVFIKKRTDKVLAVGIRYDIIDFDDVDGMYKDDTPLLWETIDDNASG